jgi:hypothetical protein
MEIRMPTQQDSVVLCVNPTEVRYRAIVEIRDMVSPRCIATIELGTHEAEEIE